MKMKKISNEWKVHQEHGCVRYVVAHHWNHDSWTQFMRNLLSCQLQSTQLMHAFFFNSTKFATIQILKNWKVCLNTKIFSCQTCTVWNIFESMLQNALFVDIAVTVGAIMPYFTPVAIKYLIKMKIHLPRDHHHSCHQTKLKWRSEREIHSKRQLQMKRNVLCNSSMATIRHKRDPHLNSMLSFHRHNYWNY